MIETPYPSLEIRLRLPGVEERSWAVVDTGFDGHVAVPESLAARLPHPAYRRRVQMASGDVVRVPVYLGSVEVLQQPRPIDALVIALDDEYLLGLASLNHFRVTFDHGHTIVVEP